MRERLKTPEGRLLFAAGLLALLVLAYGFGLVAAQLLTSG